MKNSKKETTIIKATEVYSTSMIDSSDKKSNSKRGPIGYVEIYEKTEDGDKLLVGKQNLVILQGRELIGQRLTGITNPYSVTKSNEIIYWFGLGTGGASPSDPFNPNPPLPDDTNLYNQIAISSTDSTNCTDLYSGKYYKHKIDNIEFEVDPDNNNAWLITKITVTIGISDAINSPEWAISEAGLFSSSSNVPGQARTNPSQFHLFARITFPSIVKTNTRELVFLWYIYT